MTTPNTRDHWIQSDAELRALAESDRLRQVLVRCGGCRFRAAAQDVATITAALVAAGDYVRDMSYPVEVLSDGRDPVRPPAAAPRCTRPRDSAGRPMRHEGPCPKCDRIQPPARAVRDTFRPEACGGAFDGFSVTSDADSGL